QEVVQLEYFSPYGPTPKAHLLWPQGLVWDRDQWYLVAKRVDRKEEPRFWRTDRVMACVRKPGTIPAQPTFFLQAVLGRKWMDGAMAGWAKDAPVLLKLTPAQAARLKADWYYGHARFEETPDGAVTMAYGESSREFAFE